MRFPGSELKMKSSRMKLWGGLLIGVSFTIGLFILFGLPLIFYNPQNNEPEGVPNLALTSVDLVTG